MRVKAIILCCLLGAAAAPYAQQQQDQCRQTVDATIHALEQHSAQAGTEQKLRDLSVKDIRAIRQSDGDCAAMREINKRKSSRTF